MCQRCFGYRLSSAERDRASGLAVIIYLAGAYGRKGEIIGYREELKKIAPQYTVQAAWLDEPHWPYEVMDQKTDEEKRVVARKALNDIMSSRRIIVFTGDIGRGGNQLEQGFAMGLGLEVVIIGPEANLFSLLVNRRYETWEAFLKAEFGVENEKEDFAFDGLDGRPNYGRDLDESSHE